MSTTVPIVTEVTSVELAALVASSGLNQGLQYKNTDTGRVYLATSANSYNPLLTAKTYIGTVKQFANQSSGTLVVGRKYTIGSEVQPGDDFSNVGYTSGAEFTATGTTPNVWENGTIVVPTPIEATVYENTIGDITWSRIYAGLYSASIEGGFPEKTICPPFIGSWSMIGLFYSTPFDHGYSLNTKNDPPNIQLNIIRSVDGESVEMTEALGEDELLIHIIIYD